MTDNIDELDYSISFRIGRSMMAWAAPAGVESLLLDVSTIQPIASTEVYAMAEAANHRKHWPENDVRQLKDLADKNTPTRVIGIKLKRSESAVQSKASKEGISLKPTNQAPYNRRKK